MNIGFNFCEDYLRVGYCTCGECQGYVCDLCGRISIDYWILNYGEMMDSPCDNFHCGSIRQHCALLDLFCWHDQPHVGKALGRLWGFR